MLHLENGARKDAGLAFIGRHEGEKSNCGLHKPNRVNLEKNAEILD
jgi:hypothetical protein